MALSIFFSLIITPYCFLLSHSNNSSRDMKKAGRVTAMGVEKNPTRLKVKCLFKKFWGLKETVIGSDMRAETNTPGVGGRKIR